MDSTRKINLNHQRTSLLFVPGEALSQCTIRVIEREIPGMSVHPLDDLASTGMAFDDPVRLILIDAHLADELTGCASALQAWHPAACVALIANDQRVPLSRYRELVLSGAVRGILPMNLRLDLWLSVVRLLASGGEYFPASLLQPAAVAPLAPFTRAAGEADTRPPRRGGDPGELTDREIQILDLVSRGRQNKTIAADLNLSEHTVKVHLHNIISKMQVSNRTEAASIYLERRPAPRRQGAIRPAPIAIEE